jgi:VWFA-related protein
MLAVLLFSVCAGRAAGADFIFVSPRDGEVLAGDVHVELDVRSGADVSRVDVFVAGSLAGTARPPAWSFTWKTSLAVQGAAIVGIPYDRQGRPGERVTIHSAARVVTEWVDVNAVQLYPVVKDRAGRYVHGLGRESFRVREGKTPVEIDYFSEDVERLELAVLLDISSSMSGQLSFVTAAAWELIQQLAAGDTVSVWAFNQGLQSGPARVAAPEVEAVEPFIRGLTPRGGTALYDSVAEVLDDLSSATARKALIVFSDGRDDSSLLTLAQVLDRARRGDAIVYTIAAADPSGDAEARRDLTGLASETGGQALFFDSYRKLDEVFESILADLRSQYALSYTPPPGEEGVRSITVEIPGTGYRVRCRTSYLYRQRRH